MTTDLINALRQTVTEAIHELDAHPRVHAFALGTVDTQEYAGFLTQTYHYVRWTCPLLESAGRRLMNSSEKQLLAKLFLDKSSEENAHELWLLADLSNLGYGNRAVTSAPVSGVVEAYVAWNRFVVETGTPVGFLGTAFVLESLAVLRAGPLVRSLLEQSRIPNIGKALTFLRGHADADPEHVAELEAIFDWLDDAADREAILLSARVTAKLYPSLFSVARTCGMGLCTDARGVNTTPGHGSLQSVGKVHECSPA